MKCSLLAWDEAEGDAVLKQLTTVFPKESFAARPKSTYFGKAPIFIVGIPRSGTMLLEQILSTHPAVFGAGELTDLNEVVIETTPGADYKQYPNAIASFSGEEFRRVGEKHAERAWCQFPALRRPPFSA